MLKDKQMMRDGTWKYMQALIIEKVVCKILSLWTYDNNDDNLIVKIVDSNDLHNFDI